ncbi:LOW QUALITY PROTEIN: hypothetical protein T265_13394 [Opisthorchis viverrini]|uniref:Uncharacterized protein n=1 Tax=Opisthorchis viverrini TaxID=6198 RepID=A0A074ZQH7_OPIVI|nr:LOW QUALITY PROTEIN: hypothetical protein T265_13394 [Opisthorchis viverrini]KER29376.1 LOW QUALITY PROTEIN: hypothetical protein T265_13394 [Opisthorchis viverrini]
MSDGKIDDALLKQMFLKGLPAHVSDTAPLAGLVNIADKILEIQPNSSNISTVEFTKLMSAIHDRLDTLATQIADIRLSRPHPFRRAHFLSRSRSPSHSNSRSHVYCWYHSTIGSRAQNCSQLCSFQRRYPSPYLLSEKCTGRTIETSKFQGPAHTTRRLTVVDKTSGLHFLTPELTSVLSL